MVQTRTSLPKTHLPLVIDYFDGDWEITAEEGAGIILALQQRDRVRLQIVVPNSQKLIMAMDEEYPVLDHLVIAPSMEDKCTALILSDTLQAPHHLRHLAPRGFFLPEGFPLSHFVLLWTTHPPTSIQIANTLLQWSSSIPQLETLMVAFSFPVPNRGVEATHPYANYDTRYIS